MESILLLCAVVIVICIVASRLSQRLGVPALLLFLALGMLFGSDGLFRIPFDNFEAAERICSVALIFIMFYGGFGTRWEAARPAAARAVVLSTLGVAVTALLTALFCHFALGFSVLESFLTGAVISSTDAASVFSILRSKKLGLRNHTASLLEVESGSNDPASYMLTVIALSLMGVGGGGAIPWMIFAQVVFGLGLGAAVAGLSILVLRRLTLSDGLDTIFVVAAALLSFALPAVVGGNGYLGAYLAGILIGNAKIPHKAALVHFFDGLTGLAQILIFFLLGLLSFTAAPGGFSPGFGHYGVSHLCGPARCGLPAAGPLPLRGTAVSAGVLGGAAGRGIYRVCHHGSGQRGRHRLRPLSHRVLHCPALGGGAGFTTASGGAEAGHGGQG